MLPDDLDSPGMYSVVQREGGNEGFVQSYYTGSPVQPLQSWLLGSLSMVN